MSFYTRYKPPKSQPVVMESPSMARQEFKTDADINHIMERYKETGMLSDPLHPSSRKPLFGDFSNISDYQSALDALIQAREAFESLPAAFRAELDNDPANLEKWLQDPSNRDKAIAYGLIEKPVEKPVEKSVEKQE